MIPFPNIRHHALVGMLRLETAATNWFQRLGKREQDAYLRAHPKSRFGHGGDLPTTRAELVRHHERLHAFHADSGHAREAALHVDAMELHRAAAPGDSRAYATALRASRKANVASRNVIATEGKRATNIRTSRPDAYNADLYNKNRSHYLDHNKGTYFVMQGKGDRARKIGEAPTEAEATRLMNEAVQAPTTSKPPKGVKIAENGIELHPIAHPEAAWTGAGSGVHNVGGRQKTAHAYAMHKNGVRIGTVHSTVHTENHKISGSRLISHRTHRRRYKLTMDPQHLSDRSRMGAGGYSGFGSLKDAVTRAGDITHGESKPRVTKRMANVDHEAEAKRHDRMALVHERVAVQRGYRDKVGQKHERARWRHHYAAEAHRRAQTDTVDGRDDRVRSALKSTREANSLSTRLGYHPANVLD